MGVWDLNREPITLVFAVLLLAGLPGCDEKAAAPPSPPTAPEPAPAMEKDEPKKPALQKWSAVARLTSIDPEKEDRLARGDKVEDKHVPEEAELKGELSIDDQASAVGVLQLGDLSLTVSGWVEDAKLRGKLESERARGTFVLTEKDGTWMGQTRLSLTTEQDGKESVQAFAGVLKLSK